MCKHHLSNHVKYTLRLTCREVYREAAKAFTEMDYTGRGYITADDIFSSIIMSRIKYSKEDV